MKTIKILALTMVTTLTLGGCNKILDVEPTQSISADEAIKDKTGVQRAIIGAYNILQSSGYYGRTYVINGDLASNNLIWTGTTLSYGQVNNHTIPADNGIVESIWSAIYDGINRVNNILEKIPSITDMTQAERNNFLGECYFLRGLFHFDLVRLYGEVPIKTKPTSGTDPAQLYVFRDPVADVYQQVLSDLSQAESLLPPTSNIGYANAYAAKALMARVYLYQYHLTNDPAIADSAVLKATEVLQSGKYSLVPDFGELFESDANSESIFEVPFSAQDKNLLAYYYFPRVMTGRYEIAPSDTLISSFEPNDVRDTVSIKYDGDNLPYGDKYRDILSGTDRVYILRLAEMYLIRAEANACMEKSSGQIISDLNAIRLRAKVPEVTTNDYTELRWFTLRENQHEFAFEGHWWFDLVRTGNATTVLDIKDWQTLFPIPQSERNANPNMTQNTGY